MQRLSALTIPLFALLGLAAVLGLTAVLRGCGSDYGAEADAAFASGALTRAITLYEVIGPDRWTDEQRLRHAIATVRDGARPAAIDAITELARVPGRRGDRALRELSRALGRTADGAAIEERFAPFLETEPVRPTALSAYGYALSLAADREEQKLDQLLVDALGVKNGRIAFFFCRRVIYGDEDRFEVELERAIRTYSDLSGGPIAGFEETVRAQRARVLRAEAELRSGYAADPDSFDALGQLGEYAVRGARIGEALDILERFLAIDLEQRDDVESIKIINTLRYQSAMGALRLALEDPGFERPLRIAERVWNDFSTLLRQGIRPMYAELLFRAGMHEQLGEISAQWVKERVTDPEAHFYRGVVLLGQGQVDRARTHLTTAQARDPSTARHQVWLGRAMIAGGELERGTVLLATARTMLADDIPLAIEAAELLSAKVGPAEAAKDLRNLYFRIAPERSDDRRKILDALGKVWDRAVPQNPEGWDDALRDDPNNARLGLLITRRATAFGNQGVARSIAARLSGTWPDLPEAWLCVLMTGLQFGDAALAETAAAQLTEPALRRLRPADAREAEILLALRRKDAAAAMAAVEKARAEFASDPRFASLAVRALLLSAGPTSAHGEALLLREQFPNDVALCMAAADAALAVPSRGKEVQALLDAMDAGPVDLSVVVRALQAAAAERELSALEVLIPRYEARLPKGTSGVLLLAHAFDLVGRRDRATLVLDELVKSNAPLEVRRAALERLFDWRIAAKDPIGACEMLTELRLLGEREPSRRLLARAAASAGALEEARRALRDLPDSEEQLKLLDALPRAAWDKARQAIPETAYAALDAAIATRDSTAIEAAVLGVANAYPFRAAALKGVRERLTRAESILLRRRVETAIETLAPGSIQGSAPPPGPVNRRRPR